MAAFRHLRNAPVVEALIDFRVELPATSSPEMALLAESLLRDSFPNHTERFRGQFQFVAGPKAEAQAEASSKMIGYDFSSIDGKKLTQFTIEGFTLNWLKPYSNWQELRDLTRTAWRHYVSIFAPIAVTRIGLRYINNLSLPLPVADFADFLEAPPTVPNGLPQEVSNFLTQVTLFDRGRNAHATITQATRGPTEPDALSVLLDVDVFRGAAFKCDDEEIWVTLENLHLLKNEVFFGCVTNKLLDQYV